MQQWHLWTCMRKQGVHSFRIQPTIPRAQVKGVPHAHPSSGMSCLGPALLCYATPNKATITNQPMEG